MENSAPMIMAAIGAISMAGMVGSAGVDGAENAGKLRKNIKAVHTQTANLKSRFDKVISRAVRFNDEIEREMRDTVDSIAQIKAEMRETKRNFERTKQQIQTVGVTFLVYLFSMLLLKRVGILDAFGNRARSLIFAPVPTQNVPKPLKT